jgi:hypothetical protein
MSRPVIRCTVLAAALGAFALAGTAGADPAATTSATTASGYEVTLTGPATARVGEPAAYTATCGGGYPCPYGEFRAFGGVINRLGEGFGRGAAGSYTFRSAGVHSMRYRVGAACPGSPRMACPIDVWISTYVEE